MIRKHSAEAIFIMNKRRIPSVSGLPNKTKTRGGEWEKEMTQE
jgi:hypothetical protein